MRASMRVCEEEVCTRKEEKRGSYERVALWRALCIIKKGN